MTDTDMVELTVNGNNFIEGLECVFEGAHFRSTVTATLISSTQIKC